VGAGPGDPELITVRGAKALGRADVVLYDELATEELLGIAPDRARLVNVGKRGHEAPTRTQEDINALLVEEASAGRLVVRLKGGDPLVFGRGGEEASACAEAGIPFEFVPGVSSAIAAPAYAGIPVTDRRHAASFAVVTGHADPTRVSSETRWRELGRVADTLVILMGMRTLAGLVAEMLAGGLPPETPAAAIMNGTLPSQRTCVSTLGELPDAVRVAGLAAPTTIVIGGVVDLRTGLSWWEIQPLFGKRVLVTRAREQSSELASALRAVGAEPVLRPMIELVASTDAEVQTQIETALDALETYHAFVFTSSNAARFFARALRARGREALDAMATARCFCVGEQTAAAALSAGFAVHGVASGRSDADALLAQLREVLPGRGERVLIPRSRIGRTVIADGLSEFGVSVDSIPFYENRRPVVDVANLREMLVEGELFALTFTSPSTVDHFFECLDDGSREAASRCMIAAIGRTTAGRLESLGMAVRVVPDRPDVTEMVAGLVDAASTD
jgi:uroporphyrinogen III methyltransferase/synthase